MIKSPIMVPAGALMLLSCFLLHSSSISAFRAKRQLFFTETEVDLFDCNDYAGMRGICGPIANCPAFTAILAKPSRVDLNKIRKSICGFESTVSGRKPLLCCAPGGQGQGGNGQTSGQLISTKPPPTTSPTTSTSQSSTASTIANHPNRRLLPSPPTCGSGLTSRIVGGNRTYPDQYPWVAVLVYSISGTSRTEVNCGGSLISSRYVLTAAHCVIHLPKEFSVKAVRLGEYRINSDNDCLQVGDEYRCSEMEEFTPEKIMPHESYSRPEKFFNDIALIRLDRTTSKSTICMPFRPISDKFLDGGILMVAGFGVTEPFGEGSTVMLHLRVPFINNTVCRPIFERRNSVIGSDQLCAGGELGRDSCGGDSGGPLMHGSKFGPPFTLAGVVSYGVTRCGTENVPGVYTRVSSYMEWILDRMEP